ncbi:MAG: hypothetical protein GC180_07060 [Bacteroidetes bacterium]|nr:hypothetical protein [Bacteroidota bacterium]
MKVLLSKDLLPSQLEPLQKANIDYFIAPSSAITPLQLTQNEFIGYGVISSKNALSAMKEHIHRLPNHLFIVGESSAKAIAELGYQGSIEVFDSIRELLPVLLSHTPNTVHYFCGSIHRDELEKGIHSRPQFHLEMHTCYQTTPLFPELPKEHWAAVLAFSPRSLQNLLHQNNLNTETPLFCLGPSTAEEARQRGFQHIYISKKPKTELLIQLLIDCLHDTERFISSHA